MMPFFLWTTKRSNGFGGDYDDDYDDEDDEDDDDDDDDYDHYQVGPC